MKSKGIKMVAFLMSLVLVGCGKESVESISEQNNDNSAINSAYTVNDNSENASDIANDDISVENGVSEVESATDNSSNIQEPESKEITMESWFLGVNVPNTTIYDADGITMNFERFEFDNQENLHAVISVSNNNSENRKLFMEGRQVSINGVSVRGGGSVKFVHDGLESGNTTELHVQIDKHLYEEYFNRVCFDYTEVPLHFMKFRFKLKLGSNAEPSLAAATIYTDDYSSELFSSGEIYGKKINTVDTENSTIDVYCKQANDTYYITLLYNSDEENEGFLPISFNRTIIHECYPLSAQYVSRDFASAYMIPLTLDELRKKCEIQNDTSVYMICDDFVLCELSDNESGSTGTPAFSEEVAKKMFLEVLKDEYLEFPLDYDSVTISTTLDGEYYNIEAYYDNKKVGEGKMHSIYGTGTQSTEIYKWREYDCDYTRYLK